MIIDDRGVITLAYGLPKYIEMAKTLARSLRLHSPAISLAIVTDCQNDIELTTLFDIVIPLRKEYGSNVRQKLYLNKYSPYKKTAFIDSDCIVVRDIQFIFEKLEGISFSAVGDNFLEVGQKNPFVDVDRILTTFSLDRLPHFNGGLYYFERNDTTKAVFETAQDILSNYRELGFFEFRGDGPGDEPIFSLAMMLHKQSMFEDHGSMMRTPLGTRSSIDVDVLTGKSFFEKNKKIVSPAIIHFAAFWNEHPVYYREALKLKNLNKCKYYQDNFKIFSDVQLKFGYQIAVARYIAQQLTKTPKYYKNIANKLLKKVFLFTA